MTRLFARIAGFFLLVTAATGASAQEQAACRDCLTAQEARADLASLYAILQQEHVDLFARRSEAEYDAKIAELRARISGPIAKPDFNLLVQEALAFGNIGHAKTDAPVGDTIAYVQAGGTIVPLSIVYRGDSMLTDEWADTTDDMPPGSRVTRIGGMTMQQFEDRARELIAADTPRLLRAQVEMALPVYLHQMFGPVDALAVEYVASDGTTRSREIAAMTYGEMLALQESRPVVQPERRASTRIAREMPDDIYYLQPGPFFATEEERGDGEGDYAIGAFSSFVDEAFASMARSGARDLLIDLRGNPGGDASFSDLIVARLVDEPFRHSSRYEIRAGANTKRIWQDREIDSDTLGGKVGSAIAAARVGERVAIELPSIEPIDENAFEGRVWLLVDKHSYSNAAVVAALMQDLDIATIMGEETADLPTTYGAVERFSLPNSGASIVYPKAYMVRPSGSEEVRGVVPEYPIAPNPIGEKRDLMLETALTQIRAARR